MWSMALATKGYLPKQESAPLFDSYPNYRYLDSGVFTLIQLSGVLRKRTGGKPLKKGKKRPALTSELIEESFQDYLQYLQENHHWFDFLIEYDVDALPNGEVLAARYREELFEVVGAKLLPVWHIQQGIEGARKLLKRFPYIALGSTVPLLSDLARSICDQAHASGVIVHGLGTSTLSILQQTALDTADSTRWLAGAQFAHYGEGFVAGSSGSSKQSVESHSSRSSPTNLSRALRLHSMVEEMGLDPQDLVASGNVKKKYRVAIAFMLQVQAEWRALPAKSQLSRPSLFA